MKHILRLVPVLYLALSLTSGCNKPESIPDESTYTFTNNVGKKIYFDVYGSRIDYGTNNNRLNRYIIEAGAEQKLTLEVGKSYWIDWYTSDYLYNNWRSTFVSSSDRPSPASELKVAAVDDKLQVNASYLDTARSVILNGTGVSSTWKAVVNNVTSINGQHIFTFRKDFMGGYRYIDQSGRTTDVLFRYGITPITFTTIGKPQNFRISMLNSGSASFCLASCNVGTTTTPHTGRDSLSLQFTSVSSSSLIFAVRQ